MVTRKPYPTDLTDEQYSRLEALLSKAKKPERPRSVDMREIMNAILYVLRNGCTWPTLSHDLPPWQTMYSYLKRFERMEVWSSINRVLLGGHVKGCVNWLRRSPRPGGWLLFNAVFVLGSGKDFW